MIKNFFKTFVALSFLILPLLAFGVTQKEMEQARTIAAKAYLRYANDGSGYLDDLNPKTMEELEGIIKPKEKENLKAFKNIPVPSDYKDWNKEKLVEYWAVTAFQDKGLLEKGRGGRLRARSQINKMTIAPPQPEAPAEAAQAVNPNVAADSTLSLNDFNPDANTALGTEEIPEESLNVEKATNYTWVYIMILGILVAIVVALVVYAANVFKKSGKQEGNHNTSLQEDTEHLESLVADKEVEISMLKRKLEAATKQNSELKSKVETLEAELVSLRNANRFAPAAEPRKTRETPVEEPAKPLLRTIFLGRANSRGIFVRADRSLNIGNSVFVLDTSDGYTGTFRVADSPAAWSLALSNPKEYLETACTGHDLDNTVNVSRIITETSGTAVFEGGCWKVIRKAKIRYVD